MCIKGVVYRCLTIVNLILIATFRPHTAGFHQAIVSILIICNTVVVSAHGWLVSIQSIVGIVRGGN